MPSAKAQVNIRLVAEYRDLIRRLAYVTDTVESKVVEDAIVSHAINLMIFLSTAGGDPSHIQLLRKGVEACAGGFLHFHAPGDLYISDVEDADDEDKHEDIEEWMHRVWLRRHESKDPQMEGSPSESETAQTSEKD